MSNTLFIMGMVALTFIPRYVPFLLAGKISLPHWAKRALHYVPIAVLTAIVAQASLIHQGVVQIDLNNHHLLAAMVAFFVSLTTRHMFFTILMGLLSFLLARWLL